MIDHKLYVYGIGTVLEQTIKGGCERNALVSVGPGWGGCPGSHEACDCHGASF
jgi:hypothetical protein